MRPCKYCGIPIYFNTAFKSESGKSIPLEDDDEPHNCPNNPYNAGGSGPRESGRADVIAMGNSITNLENDIAKLNKNVLKLIVEVQTLQKRIEGQMPLTFGMSAPEPNPDTNSCSASGNQLGDDSNADLSS